MKTMVIATSNAHKVKEFKAMLTPLGYDVKSLLDFPEPLDIEETGTTFEANALIKAKAIYEQLHIPVISDDSGIAINHLHGEPGVHSARFLGHDTSYEVKNEHILKLLEDAQDRGAQYVCVIAYIEANGVEHVFRGECAGRIAHEAKGDEGFGYDPIFYYPPFKTTLANVSEEQKHSISHRGLALAKLLAYMEGK